MVADQTKFQQKRGAQREDVAAMSRPDQTILTACAAVVVPRYVLALATLAENHGLRVDPFLLQKVGDKEWSDTRLVSVWRGLGQQFLATGLFTPSVARILDSRFDVQSAILSVPRKGLRWEDFGNSLILGRVSTVEVPCNQAKLPMALRRVVARVK
jgi:hypothetical protein